MDEESNCGNCYFWGFLESITPNDRIGMCRIKPPVIVPELMDMESDLKRAPSVMTGTAFPVTADKAWCGEFRHKNRMP